MQSIDYTDKPCNDGVIGVLERLAIRDDERCRLMGIYIFPPVNFVIASDQRERGDPKSFGLSRLLRRLWLLAMTENKRFSKIDRWQGFIWTIIA